MPSHATVSRQQTRLVVTLSGAARSGHPPTSEEAVCKRDALLADILEALGLAMRCGEQSHSALSLDVMLSMKRVGC